MRIVIAGYGPATTNALKAISCYKETANVDKLEITVISAEKEQAYAPMFLGDYITGKLGEEQLLLPEEHGLPIERILGKRLIGINCAENKVVIEGDKEIPYDKLLIATGASAVIPPIKGISKQGTYFFNRLEDAKKLLKEIVNVERIIIIGGGAIGIELANAFNNLGKRVEVIELFDHILPQVLEKDIGRWVERKLREGGINFLLGETASEITGNGRASGIIIGGKEIRSDLILITGGVQPNIDFLKHSEIKTSRGILVNETMQTNLPNVYAAGDVAESKNLYGEYELVPSWYSAIEQGMVAGCNLIGIKRVYQFCPALVCLKGLDFPVISIGCINGVAGYDAWSYTSKGSGIFERFFTKDDYIVGYQSVGISNKVGLMYNLTRERKIIDNLHDILRSDSFDIAKLTI